jgi:monofunctional biosynthetic peptidoglycan transglycosylase
MVFRVLLLVSLSSLSILMMGCSWLGLPDVSVLKTRYPLVHYTPLPKSLAKPPVSKRPPQSEGKNKASQKKPRETSITFEKNRPPQWVLISEVSKKAVGAIVVSEDWAFYSHKGYDPNQMKEAMNHDLAKGKFARGASTITQQVAKNVFLDSDKTMIRKLKELYLAVKLEETLKKPKILEIYLNIAEFGEGLYGIGNAARFYFGKPASELTAKEGAFLAMLLPSPKRYSVSFRQKHLTAYARKTIFTILGKMVQARYLTEEEKDAERAQPLSFETNASVATDPAEDKAASGSDSDDSDDLDDESGKSGDVPKIDSSESKDP